MGVGAMARVDTWSRPLRARPPVAGSGCELMVRLRVGPGRWVERVALVTAWVVVDTSLRLGVALPSLARRCRMAIGLDEGGVLRPAEVPVRDLTAVERRRLTIIDAIASRWPLGAGPCLRRALLAGWVLRRHSPQLRLGVAEPGGPAQVSAHAWVELPDGRTFAHQPGFVTLLSGRPRGGQSR